MRQFRICFLIAALCVVIQIGTVINGPEGFVFLDRYVFPAKARLMPLFKSIFIFHPSTTIQGSVPIGDVCPFLGTNDSTDKCFIFAITAQRETGWNFGNFSKVGDFRIIEAQGRIDISQNGRSLAKILYGSPCLQRIKFSFWYHFLWDYSTSFKVFVIDFYKDVSSLDGYQSFGTFKSGFRRRLGSEPEIAGKDREAGGDGGEPDSGPHRPEIIGRLSIGLIPVVIGFFFAFCAASIRYEESPFLRRFLLGLGFLSDTIGCLGFIFRPLGLRMRYGHEYRQEENRDKVV